MWLVMDDFNLHKEVSSYLVLTVFFFFITFFMSFWENNFSTLTLSIPYKVDFTSHIWGTKDKHPSPLCISWT